MEYNSNLRRTGMINATHADVQRVQEDLAIVKQAMGMPARHEPRQVWGNAGLAACGAVIATVTAYSGIASEPIVRGSINHWLYVALITFPIGLALLGLAIELRRRKQLATLSSRATKQSMVAAAIALPCYFGFVGWGLSKGLSADTITATTFFVVG